MTSSFPFAIVLLLGGGEAAETKVSNSDEIRQRAAEISDTFSSDMRRRTIPMINPTEALTVIGRETLNYCSNYGEE